MSMRASRGSTGSRAIVRPTFVRRSSSSAPSSCRPRTASFTARGSGGSMKGKRDTSPSRNARICSTTEARFVRVSSGSV